MRIYNTSGEEIQRCDCDFSIGRLLQDRNDPEKYIFSPWDEIPLREEENAPEISQEDRTEAQALYTALMTNTVLED